MDIRLCLPIIKESKEEIINMISENPDFDFYEIWLAYVKDLDTDFVWKLSEQFNGKLIFLFRKQNLEKSDLEKELKEKIIKLLENSNNFLDLDISNQKEELDFVKEQKLNNKLVISFHNYKETPRLEELEEITKDMDSRFRGNDNVIFKVSTFCKTPEDGIKLLTLLLKLKEQKKKFIVLGMGEEGVIVRIYGALWGNEFNFAPVSEDEKSAPGQITKERLEKILKELDPGSSPV
jgi:3-dehydroquinate dehydratase type I